MRAKILLVLTALGLVPTVANSKDMFDVSGTKTKRAPDVRLQVNVQSDENLGFIRQAGNYDNGTWTLPQAVPCGESAQYFEVWSKQNFGKLPGIHFPGIAAGGLRSIFSLSGGVKDVKGVRVDRSVKGTLKKQSHWEGQDFGVRIHLTCK